jgi:HEAT repeat protein
MRSVTLYLAAILLAALTCASSSAEDKKTPKYQRKPLEFWIKQLDSDVDKQRALAMEAISSFVPDATPALPILIEMLDEKCASYRHWAANTIAGIGAGAKDHLPALIAQLKNKDEEVVASVVITLRKIGADAKPAIPALLERLKKDDYSETGSSTWPLFSQDLEALEEIDPSNAEVIAVVIELLRKGNFGVPAPREASVLEYYLAKVGPKASKAVPALAQRIQRGKEYNAVEARSESLCRFYFEPDPTFNTLAKIGVEAVPVLLEFLKDDDRNIAVRSAEALWLIEKHKMSIEFFMDTLKFDYKLQIPVPTKANDESTKELPPNWYDANKRAGRIISFLGRQGPAAKQFLPLLKQWRDSKEIKIQGDFRQSLKEAIEKIEAETPGEGKKE